MVASPEMLVGFEEMNIIFWVSSKVKIAAKEKKRNNVLIKTFYLGSTRKRHSFRS